MIGLPKESRFAYLEIVDRGSLQRPSDAILRAVVILWKIFVGIVNDEITSLGAYKTDISFSSYTVFRTQLQ